MEEDIRVKSPNPVFEGTLNVSEAWRVISRLLSEEHGVQFSKVPIRPKPDSDLIQQADGTYTLNETATSKGA